jgi:hypothetical protein
LPASSESSTEHQSRRIASRFDEQRLQDGQQAFCRKWLGAEQLLAVQILSLSIILRRPLGRLLPICASSLAFASACVDALSGGQEHVFVAQKVAGVETGRVEAGEKAGEQ